jgi:hypothetical protein
LILRNPTPPNARVDRAMQEIQLDTFVKLLERGYGLSS